MVIRQSRQKEPHSGLYDHDLPEHVILVSDWLGELGVSKFVAHHHDDGDNKPNSMIINGRGRLPKHRGELTTNETMPLSLFSVEQVGQGFSKSCFKACIDFPVSTALPYTIKAKFVLANDFSSFSELIATFKSVEGLCILEKPLTVLGSH